MRFSSAETFSQSLRDRLRRLAGPDNSAEIQRLSKLVAYSRLLDRIAKTYPHEWVVKGGVAMELRLGGSARFTRDLDLAFGNDLDVDSILITAAEHDSGDFFNYEIERTRRTEGRGSVTTYRYSVRAVVGDRLWDRFVLDVGLGDLVPAAPELVPLPPLLDFAGISASAAPLISTEQHVAEKLHAFTYVFSDGRTNSRVKDLVDLVLLGHHLQFSEALLRSAIKSVFDKRGTHPVPSDIPSPPSSWATPYADLAQSVALSDRVQDGYESVRRFLEPVLTAPTGQLRMWSPPDLTWRQR